MRNGQGATPSDGLAMARMMKTVCKDYTSLYNQTLMPLGLTGVQCEVLMYLYQRPSEVMETDELLHKMNISPAALSRTLTKLKQKGYVRYLPSGDRRKKHVSLTVKALEIEGQLTATLTHLEDQFFDQLSDAECGEMLAILNKLFQSTPVQRAQASGN